MKAPEWIKAFPDELLLSGLSCEAIGFLMKIRALQSKGVFLTTSTGLLKDFDPTSGRLLGEDARKCRRLLSELAPMLSVVDGKILCQETAKELAKYQHKHEVRKECGRLGGEANASRLLATSGQADKNRIEENRREKKRSTSFASSESQPEEPAIKTFECSGGGGPFSVTETMILGWSKDFPGVDVHRELGRMNAWLEANPTKRKTKAGFPRFIVSWLSREQDRPKKGHANGNSPHKRAQATEDYFAAQLDQSPFGEMSWTNE